VVAEPEVALVFSPEAWVEGLHRHLTDHGGARVRQVIMDPSLAFDEVYGTVVVSHRWPALTRAFVDAVHRRGRSILGVFDPEEPAGREFLVSLGVDRVLPSDASMAEFVDAFVAFAPETRQPAPSVTALEAAVDGTPFPAATGDADRSRRWQLVAVGGTPGAGATELAITLTSMVNRHRERAVLVDADEVVPSIAQRLGLPIEPNLRTAIESVEYGMGDVDTTLARAAPELDVVCGLPNVGAWSHVRPTEVLDVIEALGRTCRHVVANVSSRLEDIGRGGRGRYAISRAVVAEASELIGVAPATPVGITRLLGWVTDVRALNSRARVHLAVNRSPRDAFRKAELHQEIRRTFEPDSLAFLPHDPRVEAAAWSGAPVPNGPYAKAVAELATRIAPPARAATGARRGSGKRRAGLPVTAR
jgi:MinD-like ATPase involved in chromosome partitioning or flagellar assembly